MRGNRVFSNPVTFINAWDSGRCILEKAGLYTKIMEFNFIIRCHEIHKTLQLRRRADAVQGGASAKYIALQLQHRALLLSV